MNLPKSAGGPTATRGIVIIAVAVVLGLVLLAHGGHGSLIDRAASHGNTSTTVEASTPTVPIETTTSAPPQRAGLGEGRHLQRHRWRLPNAAGDSQRKFTPAGYSNVTIADTTATQTSAIYYAPGAQGDADAIAKTLGMSVTPKPSSSAASTAGRPAGAHHRDHRRRRGGRRHIDHRELTGRSCHGRRPALLGLPADPAPAASSPTSTAPCRRWWPTRRRPFRYPAQSRCCGRSPRRMHGWP